VLLGLLLGLFLYSHGVFVPFSMYASSSDS
jgi:hypothetical protein